MGRRVWERERPAACPLSCAFALLRMYVSTHLLPGITRRAGAGFLRKIAAKWKCWAARLDVPFEVAGKTSRILALHAANANLVPHGD